MLIMVKLLNSNKQLLLAIMVFNLRLMIIHVYFTFLIQFVKFIASITSGAYGVIGGGKPTSVNKNGAATGANAVTAHYAGYEAAVYAAASNYLQNKNQSRVTGGNNWKGGRGGIEII
jgi:hypothetical protein